MAAMRSLAALVMCLVALLVVPGSLARTDGSETTHYWTPTQMSTALVSFDPNVAYNIGSIGIKTAVCDGISAAKTVKKVRSFAAFRCVVTYQLPIDSNGVQRVSLWAVPDTRGGYPKDPDKVCASTASERAAASCRGPAQGDPRICELPPGYSSCVQLNAAGQTRVALYKLANDPEEDGSVGACAVTGMTGQCAYNGFLDPTRQDQITGASTVTFSATNTGWSAKVDLGTYTCSDLKGNPMSCP